MEASRRKRLAPGKSSVPNQILVQTFLDSSWSFAPVVLSYIDGMKAKEFSDLIQSRRTVRSFLPDPIPQEVLDSILEDARHCPSWSNTRPYCVAVASGKRLERLREAYIDAFEDAAELTSRRPAKILKAALTRSLPDGDFKPWRPYPKDLLPRSQQVGRALYEHVGIARGDREGRRAAQRQNLEFFGAPTVLWVLAHKKLLPFSAQDAGLMLQTLILSAKANGVDSCPLGVLSAWRHPLEAEFEVPRQYGILTGLALGYASDDPVNDFRAVHPPLCQLKARLK